MDALAKVGDFTHGGMRGQESHTDVGFDGAVMYMLLELHLRRLARWSLARKFRMLRFYEAMVNIEIKTSNAQAWDIYLIICMNRIAVD